MEAPDRARGAAGGSSVPIAPRSAATLSTKRILKIYLEKPELAGLVLLVILTGVFQIESSGVFLGLENLRGILGLLPETGLVAIGVTILMICGEFDLSVGSIFALMPMTMAVTMTHGLPFVIAAAIGFLVCVAVGLLNGYVTLAFNIPSFITTLGMLFIVRSLTVVISGGFPPVLSSDIPTWLFTSFVGPFELFRMSFLWFTLVAVLAGYVLARSNFGNWIVAVGGFRLAAAATGIPVKSMKMICFVLCSVLAGFAGMIQVFRLGSPLPSIGEGLELQAVAAAVIGGTALTGGVGTVLGGIIGALLIRVIDNGLVLSEIDANWFEFAIGVLTILAVVANSWLRSRARKIKLEVG
jgi:simple sugar transport system permease protein